VFLSDDSLTYIGEWYQDQFNGEGLIIFPFGGYLFADFKKNHINGRRVWEGDGFVIRRWSVKDALV
jgi:hypothetical protein